MTDLGMPETRYAHSGDISIAYQTMGHGPLDIVIVPGSISHVEFHHELPGFTAFLHHLSRFARVMTFAGLHTGEIEVRGAGCRRDRGAHELKGIRGQWELFAATQ